MGTIQKTRLLNNYKKGIKYVDIEETKRNGTPYAAVVLAPPDIDGGRYAVGDGEFLLLFAGYKPLDKNGKPIRLKDLGYDKLKETW